MDDEEESVHALLELQVDQLRNEFNRQERKGSSRHDTAVRTRSFSNAFTTLTLAYFSSASIILAICCPGKRDLAGLKHHAQLILDAAIHLDTDQNPIAFMRMATPLLLVALHVECHGYRESAIDKFQSWSRRSMRGISALALDSVHRQVEKDVRYAGLQQDSLRQPMMRSEHQAGRQ